MKKCYQKGAFKERTAVTTEKDLKFGCPVLRCWKGWSFVRVILASPLLAKSRREEAKGWATRPFHRTKDVTPANSKSKAGPHATI
jgi:hypothetical protein